MRNKPIDKTAAIKILERIQAGGKAVPMSLCKASVIVDPLEHNAFRVLVDMSVPNAMKAAVRLNDIGADIKLNGLGANIKFDELKSGKIKIFDTAAAIVTWDSMLNYLVMTGDLR